MTFVNLSKTITLLHISIVNATINIGLKTSLSFNDVFLFLYESVCTYLIVDNISNNR